MKQYRLGKRKVILLKDILLKKNVLTTFWNVDVTTVLILLIKVMHGMGMYKD